MAIDSAKFALGPATVYHAAYDPADPTGNEPEATNEALLVAPEDYIDVGGTTDGVKISQNQDYAELTCDQVVDKIGRRLTSRDVVFATNLAEVTLENLARANNEPLSNVTAGTGGNATSYTPTYGGSSATQPNYCSLIMDGWADDAGHVRRLLLRKCLSTESVEFSYTKEDQTVYSVSWATHFVTSNIAPYVMLDENVTVGS